MAAEFITAPEAEQDIAEAYAWYEGQRSGLGEEFFSCVDACIETIRRTPEMHAVVHENYRRGLVRRFPYAVFYENMRHALDWETNRGNGEGGRWQLNNTQLL